MRFKTLLLMLIFIGILASAGEATDRQYQPADAASVTNLSDRQPRASVYYVDIHHPQASDSNPGTESLPWRHCPGMPGWTGSATLQAGDTLFFNSGGTWAISSGNSVIDAVGGVTYDGKSWGSGERAVLRAGGPLNWGVISIAADHPTEPTIVRGFEVDANGQVTSGININWVNNAVSLTGTTKRVEDCVVHGVVSQSAQGQYEYGILVSSGYGGNRTVRNVEILDCTVYDISRGGVNVYVANDDPNSTIENVLVRGCEIYNTGQDPSYAGSALALKNHLINVTAEFNHVHNSTRGAGIGISSHNESFRGPENLTIRHNIVHDHPQMGIVLNLWGSGSADIYGNLIMKNTYQGIRFMRAMGTLSVRIYNNTLVQNYFPGWSHEILVGSNTATIPLLEVRNNVFVAHPDSIPVDDQDGDITDHSNNLFFRPGGGTLARVNGASYTAGTIHSWEPSAIASDPLLEDLANLPSGFTGNFGVDLEPYPDGLKLTAESPARDAGASLNPTYNSSVNSVSRPHGAGWDIGAYEFVPELELAGSPADQAIRLTWQVAGTVPADSTWLIEYYTQTATLPFTTADPMSTTRSYLLTENVWNYQWYTVTLHNLVGITSWLSDTVRVMPTDRFVFLPLVPQSPRP